MRALFFVLGLAVVASALAIPAAGQPDVTLTPTPTSTPEDDAETVAVQIDNTTTLAAWSYANGTWRLTFRSEVPARIVITDSARAMEAWENAEGKTAADLNPERYTITTGETVVTYPGTTYDGQAAITVATNQGMRFLATGGVRQARPPIAWETAQGLILLTGLAATFGTARWVRRRYKSEDKEVERIV